MVTFIEILEGPNAGSRFKAEDGITIGRSQADIIVKDPKISGTHAKFGIDGKGQYVLLDLDSSNGLHINGRRVKKVALLPGVIFEVGRTQFKVITVDEAEAIDFSRLITWRSLLADKLTAAIETLPSSASQYAKVQSFTPALHLKFIQGIQTDQEWTLGYGPRHAGGESLDLELLDIDAPKDAFVLSPSPGGVELKILSPDKVRLNNLTVTSDILKDGDQISFGNSILRVRYL